MTDEKHWTKPQRTAWTILEYIIIQIRLEFHQSNLPLKSANNLLELLLKIQTDVTTNDKTLFSVSELNPIYAELRLNVQTQYLIRYLAIIESENK